MHLAKNDHRAFGVPKLVKCAHFEPIVSHFGPSKVTKCLENGLLWGQKWVKSVFFQNWFWTIWGAETNEMSLFGAYFEQFWPLSSPKEP